MCDLKKMWSFNLFFVFIFTCMRASFPQQIFENYATCEFFAEAERAGEEEERLEIPNVLWEFSGTARYAQWKAVLSTCGDFSKTATKGCAPNSAVCVKNSRNARKSVLNAGRSFIYTRDDGGKLILKSVDGLACDENENFTVIIEFECEANTKTTPVFVFKDECELRIRMMKPACTLACTIQEDGHLIDLRQLGNLGTFSVQEPSVQKAFDISLCRAAPECGADDVSSCEILHDNTRVPIGNTTTQRITYNRNTNSLVIKQHAGTSKRYRKNFEINLKCKWGANGISNLKYIVPMLQGRNFKFEGESSLACIKLPMNCLLRDNIHMSHFLYNLTSLNKENAGWRVINSPAGTAMFINICGSLPMSFLNGTVCGDQYSQVCYKNERNQFVNLGSIPVNFHVVDGKVKGTFIEGSICDSNHSLTYSTEVEFSCGQIGKGPVFEAVNNCVYKIKWETPAACPRHTTTGENCVVSDATGIVNLNNLHKPADKRLAITQTSYLRYNLCGPLNEPCNNITEASVCYIRNGQELAVGSSSKILTRDDTSLILKLSGLKCDPLTVSQTNVHFHCNSVAPADGAARVNIVRDGCLFEMHIDTPLACPSVSITGECKVYDNNSVYDLSQLVRNTSNYIVKGSNPDVKYILNVCRSVINTDGALCPPYSGACMYNSKEPNLMHKYLSMGKAGDQSKPTIENGKLIIRYTYGTYCSTAEWRSTTIWFQCSTHEEGPRLSKEDPCSQAFVWRTPKACPKQVLSLQTRSTNSVCEYIHPHTSKLINFNDIRHVLTIEAKNDNYTFSVCDDNYTHAYNTPSGPVSEIIKSKVELLPDEKGPYLAYQLENSCTAKNQANKLYIHLVCDPLQQDEHFNITGISNCIFHVNLLTNLICSSKETEIDVREIEKPQEAKETGAETKSMTYSVAVEDHNKGTSGFVAGTQENSNVTNKNLVGQICTPTNRLDLKNIKPFNVTSVSGNNYAVDINRASSLCNGNICKNRHQIISEDDCPIIQPNQTHSVIKLIYSSHQSCDSGFYVSEVWLKCDVTNEEPKIITETDCNVKISYPYKEACGLLSTQESSGSSAGVVIGSSVGLLVVAVAMFGGYLVIKKRSPIMCWRSYSVIEDDKENVRVYLKDTRT